MFCLESKDIIIVELYLFHIVTQKFDRVTITRLSKLTSNYKDFLSEGSKHLVSFQAESSIHFLKCRHLLSISSWTSKSLWMSLLKCLSSGHLV